MFFSDLVCPQKSLIMPNINCRVGVRHGQHSQKNPHSFNSRQLNLLGVSVAKWSTEFPRSHHHLSGVVFLPRHSSPAPQLVYEAVSYAEPWHAICLKLVLLAKTPSWNALLDKTIKPSNCMEHQLEIKEYSKRCLFIPSFTPYRTQPINVLKKKRERSVLGI